MCKMWQCVAGPYLDPSLSTSPAGAARVDGPGMCARVRMQAEQCDHDGACRASTSCVGIYSLSRPSWTTDRLLLTDHRRRVASTRSPGDNSPEGFGASSCPGCASVGLLSQAGYDEAAGLFRLRTLRPVSCFFKTDARDPSPFWFTRSGHESYGVLLHQI